MDSLVSATEEIHSNERGRHATCCAFLFSLVIQLQSKLDLPRVKRSVTGRSDSAERSVGEGSRTSNRGDSIASEVRRVEVRMIEDIEELRPELEGDGFMNGEVLEG